MKVKIRKGDIVQVISGRQEDRGKRGEVLKVLPEEGRVVVQGVNIRKKHQRQYQTQGRTITPGIIEMESSIHISNVMMVCPSCDQPSRFAIRRENGEIQRECKNCSSLID